MLNQPATSQHLNAAGHSLGGGLALCAFMHLACAEPALRLSLAYGGVFTFGAPTVVHTATTMQALEHLACQLVGQRYGGHFAGLIQDTIVVYGMILNFMFLCRNASVSAKLPIHSFVNDMDMVPRLLESNNVMVLLQAMQHVLPIRKRLARQQANSRL